MSVFGGLKGHALGIGVAEIGLFSRFGNDFATRFTVGIARHIWNDSGPLLFV
jgi:hypothetical protein